MTIIVDDPRTEQYALFKKRAPEFKRKIQEYIDIMAAGSVNADYILEITRHLNIVRSRISDFLSITDIVQLVKDYENDQTYDISVEYGELDARISAVTQEIKASFPTSGTYLLYAEWSGDVIVPREFTSANTASIRTLMADVVSYIG